MRKMNYGYFGLTPLGDTNLWFDESDNKWKTYEECISNDDPWHFSNYANMFTYKAAKRHLRRHNEIPVGTKFLLSSLYIGQDRILVKRK